MDQDPIQYGPQQLGDTQPQSTEHDHVSSIGSSERAALKKRLEERGEVATHRRIVAERDAHFARQLKMLSGNVKVDFPAVNVAATGGDQRGKDPRLTGTTLSAEFAIAGGQFAVIDFVGTIREILP